MKFQITFQRIKFALTIVALLFVFMWSLDLMIIAINEIGHDSFVNIISVTANPFIGLFIGIFVTAMIQSSSTTTALIVAIVATGNLSIEYAIPIVLGANIGTTLTSTIVAISFITDRLEFKRAVAVGVSHDFFNILNVAIFFPLEYYYHFLQKSSSSLIALLDLNYSDTISDSSYVGFIREINIYLVDWFDMKILTLIIAFVFLLGTIKYMAFLISERMTGLTNDKIQDKILSNPFKSFSLGLLFTSLVRSSSITTSIMVPVGAKGQISTKNIFPFIVGANVGTTVTAVLASISKSEAAVSIALIHLLFNVFGALIFLCTPFVKYLPVTLATKFGEWTSEYKIIGLLYILLVFFIIPLALIYISY